MWSHAVSPLHMGAVLPPPPPPPYTPSRCLRVTPGLRLLCPCFPEPSEGSRSPSPSPISGHLLPQPTYWVLHQPAHPTHGPPALPGSPAPPSPSPSWGAPLWWGWRGFRPHPCSEGHLEGEQTRTLGTPAEPSAGRLLEAERWGRSPWSHLVPTARLAAPTLPVPPFGSVIPLQVGRSALLCRPLLRVTGRHWDKLPTPPLGTLETGWERRPLPRGLSALWPNGLPPSSLPSPGLC